MSDADDRQKDSAAKARWLEGTWGRAAQKSPERSASMATSSDIPIDPVYVASDLAPDLPERLGLPGEYPFTRGVQPTMYRGRYWTMRQYAGFGTAEESNRRYRYLL